MGGLGSIGGTHEMAINFLGSGDLPPGIYPYGLLFGQSPPPKKRGCVDQNFDIIERLFSGLFTISQFTSISELKQMAKNGQIKN